MQSFQLFDTYGNATHAVAFSSFVNELDEGSIFIMITGKMSCLVVTDVILSHSIGYIPKKESNLKSPQFCTFFN